MRAHSKEQAESGAILYIAFPGIGRKILQTLLPKVVCLLKREEHAASVRVYSMFQDFLWIELGENDIMLELAPGGFFEVLRLYVGAAEQDAGDTQNGVSFEVVRSTAERICEAVHMWQPSLSPSIKVQCPHCHGDHGTSDDGDREEANGIPHLLDLVSEILTQDRLFCVHTQRLIRDSMLPRFLRQSREKINIKRAASAPAILESKSSVSVQYLYASPLGLRGHGDRVDRVAPLSILEEMKALVTIPGIDVTMQLATHQALLAALQTTGAGSSKVLHISAHAIHSVNGGEEVCRILLEDGHGEAVILDLGQEVIKDQSGANKCGNWSGVALLVALVCSTEYWAGQLVQYCGLQNAICVRGEVHDDSASQFCRRFYEALGQGQAIRTAFDAAQQVLRVADKWQVAQDADRFIFLTSPEATQETLFASSSSRPRCPSPWILCPSQRERIFVGRARDTLDCMKHWTTRAREGVSVLHGPHGVGKREFALQLCRHFSIPGGRFFSGGAVYVDTIHGFDGQGSGRILSNLDELKESLAMKVLEQLRNREVALAAAAGGRRQIWARV